MSIVLAQLAGNRQSLETSPAVLKAPRLFCDTSEWDIPGHVGPKTLLSLQLWSYFQFCTQAKLGDQT